MPRALRQSEGGVVYHVLNRANGRAQIFEKAGEYRDFVQLLEDTRAKTPVRILSYCVMPNHWHLILRPTKDGQLSEFMQQLTVAHTHRWHARHGTSGTGHLYQGRFKSFPIQSDEHFLTVCRYVERNPLRARLVRRAENWRWSSLWLRLNGNADERGWLHPWPVDRPRSWTKRVNNAETAEELETLRLSVKRGRPYGSAAWQTRTANRMGLQPTMRPRGRPRMMKA
ncbi:MAG: transposase [Planctomycetes bacterium]|nr:transposase [Planctomycetota bacterium]